MLKVLHLDFIFKPLSFFLFAPPSFPPRLLLYLHVMKTPRTVIKLVLT